MFQFETNYKNWIKVIAFFFSILFLSQNLFAKGGISDGGGNAVGKMLFDFYENASTEKIKVEKLRAWRETLGNLLATLGKEVPYVNGLSLHQQLVNASEKKYWLLDPKPLKQEGDCLNASMVQVQDQKIIACQTSRYVRISKTWFDSADEKNANGVMLHEMFLAFLMQIPGLEKDTRDEMVRDLNRFAFEGDYKEIQKILSQELNFKVLLAQQLAYVQFLDQNSHARKEQFCSSDKVELNFEEKQALEVSENFSLTPKIYSFLMNTSQRDSKIAEQNDFCFLMDVRNQRLKADLNLIPNYCREQIPSILFNLAKEMRILKTESGFISHSIESYVLECMTSAQLKDSSARGVLKNRFGEATQSMKIYLLQMPQLVDVLNASED